MTIKAHLHYKRRQYNAIRVSSTPKRTIYLEPTLVLYTLDKEFGDLKYTLNEKLEIKMSLFGTTQGKVWHHLETFYKRGCNDRHYGLLMLRRIILDLVDSKQIKKGHIFQLDTEWDFEEGIKKYYNKVGFKKLYEESIVLDDCVLKRIRMKTTISTFLKRSALLLQS